MNTGTFWDGEDGVDRPAQDMDPLSAHLDRGWELLSRGDLAGVRRSLVKIMELNPESPEAHTLSGALVWSTGDPEGALEEFEAALELDPEYPPPMLYAAEVLAQDPERAQEALVYCDQILEMVMPDDEPSMRAEALLLKAEVLFAIGNHPGALPLVNELSSTDPPWPQVCLRLGRLLIDLERPEAAEPWLSRAVEKDDVGEGHYLLGVLAERRGDLSNAVERFLKTRRLDSLEPRPPWSLSEESFARECVDALSMLARELSSRMDPSSFLILDLPAEELILEGADPRMALYISAPRPPQETEKEPPPRVVVYKRNVERSCRAPEDIAEALADALKKDAELYFGEEVSPSTPNDPPEPS